MDFKFHLLMHAQILEHLKSIWLKMIWVFRGYFTAFIQHMVEFARHNFG